MNAQAIEYYGRKFFGHLLPIYQRLAVMAALQPPKPKPRFKGIAAIFGVREIKPIINVPADALKVRVRMRNNTFARAFVKFANRTEHWIILPADEQTQACPEWKLGYQQGANLTSIDSAATIRRTEPRPG